MIASGARSVVTSPLVTSLVSELSGLVPFEVVAEGVVSLISLLDPPLRSEFDMLEEVVVPEATSEDISLPSLAARVSPVCDGTSLVSTVSPLRPSLLRETSLVVTLPEEAVGVPSPGLWPLFSEQLAATMTPKTHAALRTRRVEEPGTIKLGMEVCLISNRGIPLVAGCARFMRERRRPITPPPASADTLSPRTREVADVAAGMHRSV
jgi:hypothetical protein